MKKVRIFVVFVTASLLLMGIGYAAWSQSIPINVTGSIARLDVVVTGAGVVLPDDIANGSQDAQSAYKEKTKISFTDNDADITANKLLPGEHRDYTVTFTNNGDLPAVLKSVSLNRGDRSDILNNITVAVNGIERHMNGNSTIPLNQDLAAGATLTITIRIQLNSDNDNNCDNNNSSNSGTFSLKITPDFEQGR